MFTELRKEVARTCDGLYGRQVRQVLESGTVRKGVAQPVPETLSDSDAQPCGTIMAPD